LKRKENQTKPPTIRSLPPITDKKEDLDTGNLTDYDTEFFEIPYPAHLAEIAAAS
jgi:hypothetical protein